MAFSILGTGDAMLLEPFPSEYDIQDIRNYILGADVSITNLEMVPVKSKTYASTFCGGQWIWTDPGNVEELKKYGFDIFSCANNHSMDFSSQGVVETCEVLEEYQIPYAGIGRSLDDASAPVIFSAVDSEGNRKKVAVISVTTTFLDPARAGNENEFFGARPGVNALRRKEIYYVTLEQMNTLREIGEQTYINGERDNARKIGSLPPEKQGTFNFGGIFFEENIKAGKYTSCDERDLNRIRQEIVNARMEADYVVIMAHSHQIKYDSYENPDYFFEEFCHMCIDEGACCVIGGGTHQMKPIEIYKGKPIFYSLGNFIFQLDRIKKLPDDFWDKYGYDRSMTIKQCLLKRNKGNTIGLEKDINNYLTVLPLITFEGDKVKTITLLPVELNYENEKKGLPRIADYKYAKYISDYLDRISKPYGLNFEMNQAKKGGRFLYLIELQMDRRD